MQAWKGENMEYFGIISFVMVILLLSCPDRIKKLEAKVNNLEKQRKGEAAMSKLIQDLVGQSCKITAETGLSLAGKAQFECYVLDYDEEWLKIRLRDRKGNEVVKMMRVEDISDIELL